MLEPGAARAAFVLERTPPHPALAGRIERHWLTRWDLRGRADHVQRVLPHPCVNLVAYDGIVRVHGVPTGVDARRLTGAGCAIGTKFRPGAFAAYAAVPMPALRARPSRWRRRSARTAARSRRRSWRRSPTRRRSRRP